MFDIDVSDTLRVRVSSDVTRECLYMVVRSDQHELIVHVVGQHDDVGVGR